MLGLLALIGCPAPPEVASSSPEAAPSAALSARCEALGPPSVSEVAPGVWLARGYDLASTIVITTATGRIVVDAAMSPARAREARAALDAVTQGPVLALVFTHSHIDHVGGASVWVEPGTEVWATDAFTERFFDQYGVFLPSEAARGARQFGSRLDAEALPCSSLGRVPDLKASLEQGVVLPTHTFSGQHTLVRDGVTLELVEAHGETTDQLFVWLADRAVLLPGDNWYRAFPNLYTLRGTAPRPIDAWIESLDAMRALDAAVLVPSHTAPVFGRDAVRHELTDYRDAIQWVRDAVVRGVNQGRRLDRLTTEIRLPPHLAANPNLAEVYGAVPWAVRAIHGNEVGWFDGRGSDVLPVEDRARRTVDLVGGPDRVLEEARVALTAGDAAWAVELLDWLVQDGRVPQATLDPALSAAYADLAGTTANTNARAYLLQSAVERLHGVGSIGEPQLAPAFVEQIPVDHLMRAMVARLRPEEALDVHESLRIHFDDEARTATITVRRGVAEVAWGEPLPGTPAPVGTITTTAATWRALALNRTSAPEAWASGELALDGSTIAVTTFLGRFERGLAPPPSDRP